MSNGERYWLVFVIFMMGLSIVNLSNRITKLERECVRAVQP